MTESKFDIQLLPKGGFLITLEDGQKVKGRFSMFALDRFAERKNLEGYFNIVVKLTVGMKLMEYAELILVALEDYYREDFEQCQLEKDGRKTRWTKELVSDLILEPMGGLGTKLSKDFFVHAVGRLSEVIEEQPDTEKKNQPLGNPE